MNWTLIFVAIVVIIFIFDYLASLKKKRIALPYLELLRDNNPDVRESAANSLGEIGHAIAVPQLIIALEDISPRVREASVRALGKIENESSVLNIADVAVNDESPTVRLTAVDALQVMGSSYRSYIRGTELLLSIQASQRAAALQELIDTYIVPGLTLALQDEDTQVRQVATAALKKLEIPDTSVNVGSTSNEPVARKVQFTAIYPLEIRSGTWNRLYLHAHLAENTAEIKTLVKNLSRWIGQRVLAKTAKQGAQIRLNTLITVVPESNQAQFEPLTGTKPWNGESTSFEFRFALSENSDVDIVELRVSIQVEGIEIAQISPLIKLTERVTQPAIHDKNPLAQARANSQTTSIYQKIFVSYSRKDKEVVEAYRFAQLALGNEIFMDSYSIRSGENWRTALARAIDTADVFQLFWSKNSATSTNVYDEWDYALKYRCPETRCENFIRPVYWVKPIPIKPPDDLRHLNFRYVPLKKHFLNKESRRRN